MPPPAPDEETVAALLRTQRQATDVTNDELDRLWRRLERGAPPSVDASRTQAWLLGWIVSAAAVAAALAFVYLRPDRKTTPAAPIAAAPTQGATAAPRKVPAVETERPERPDRPGRALPASEQRPIIQVLAAQGIDKGAFAQQAKDLGAILVECDVAGAIELRTDRFGDVDRIRAPDASSTAYDCLQGRLRRHRLPVASSMRAGPDGLGGWVRIQLRP